MADRKPYRAPSPEVRDLLSAFGAGRGGGGRGGGSLGGNVSLIEPLTGVARHPLWSACPKEKTTRGLFDIR